MSLVGSLEDLGLADILQIVSLSRKSGVLMLRSESGDGRIVLRNGLVQGATVKGEAEDLRSLLVSQGFVEAEAFDRARQGAGSGSAELDEALNRVCGLTPERLASLRREHVERSVIQMFSWRSGEFSFDVGEELSAADGQLLLPTGINTQFLAMEATRLGDENLRDQNGADTSDTDIDDPVLSGEEIFSGEEPDASAVTGIQALAQVAAQRHDEAILDVEPPIEATPVPPAESADVEISGPPSGASRVRVPVHGKSGTGAGSASHLVAIDPDLSSLEWLKASVKGLFARVHIFQRRDSALDRIRQYLARGVVPLVVVNDTGRDRRKAGGASFVERLQALAPTLPILALRPEHSANEPAAEVDGVVIRPASPPADPDRWHAYQTLADRLRRDLEPWAKGEYTVIERRRTLGVLGRLKGVSDRLRDPSTEGEVLSLVLEYAGETFERVAMFMLRDEVAIGIAQHGLTPTGGPDDAGMRTLEFDASAMPELFQAVLAERTARRRALTGPRDRQLAMRLGAAAPREAYAAPIESGGCVVALVYADNLPDERPLPDTTAFEIVLHEAGLVLDRTVLERTLAERG